MEIRVELHHHFFPCGIVRNKKYRATYQITNYVSGNVAIYFGGFLGGTARTANGIYTEDLTPTNSRTNLNIDILGNNFVGSIDNIHIYELPTWSSTGNHSISQSRIDWMQNGTDSTSLQITSSGAGSQSSGYAYLTQQLGTVAGNKYTIEGYARGTGSLGSDLNTGYDFNAWTLRANTTIDSTHGFSNSVDGGGAWKVFNLTVGATYKIIVDATVTTNTYTIHNTDNLTNNSPIASNLASGFNTFIFNASYASIYLRSNGIGKIGFRKFTAANN